MNTPQDHLRERFFLIQMALLRILIATDFHQ